MAVAAALTLHVHPVLSPLLVPTLGSEVTGVGTRYAVDKGLVLERTYQSVVVTIDSLLQIPPQVHRYLVRGVCWYRSVRQNGRRCRPRSTPHSARLRLSPHLRLAVSE